MVLTSLYSGIKLLYAWTVFLFLKLSRRVILTGISMRKARWFIQSMPGPRSSVGGVSSGDVSEKGYGVTDYK